MNFIDRQEPLYEEYGRIGNTQPAPTDVLPQDEDDDPSVAPYKRIARRLRVEFLPDVDASRLVLREDECLAALSCPDPIVAAYLGPQYETATILVGPSRRGVERLPRLAAQSAVIRERFRVIPHKLLRAAIFQRVSEMLTRRAVYGLFDKSPEFSARTVLDPRQASLATALVFSMLWLFLAAPDHFLMGLHVLASLAFFSCTMLRVLAALRSKGPPPPITRRPDEPQPVYTVLVPLHREAAVVPQLLVALGRLVWPRDRLEIKLICEADDVETINAIRAHKLQHFVELIEVPPSLPRTKPKALRYALQAASGEFVVLYDAEDIPHPMQLQEAWRRFCSEGQELACLQAPLDITNARASWISRMFAFEYAGLFRVMLPWLAETGSVMPLGGTSNHFRRSALEKVGGWDPHNVTEDADLGVRLARFGYRCGVISMPTKEAAPETFGVWLPQRSRWSKGWMQTWLVHMRQPVRLFRDLGPASFVISQVLLFGIVFSTLAHPFIVYAVAEMMVALFTGYQLSPWKVALFCVDLINIVCAYGAYIAITIVALKQRGVRVGWTRYVAMTPIYWFMMSAAAWLGLFELWWRPFHWNKTPHKPIRRLKVGPRSVVL